MRANKSRDTKPELALRRLLHSQGLRYRVGLRIDLPSRRVRPDIVFSRRRVAVFVDGCYWHGCPSHGRMPSDPTGYWHQKIARNRERDELVNRALHRAGWTVVRVWEHVPAEQAARIVRNAFDSVGASPALELDQPGQEG